MAKCKECGWARLGLGDPLMGYCIYGRSDVSGEEATTGVESSVVPARAINLRDEACEHFRPKASVRDFMKEGV